MKIDKLETSGFKKDAGMKAYVLPKVGAMIGPNGVGKTTVFDAMRFALTGYVPDGCDLVNKACDRASATIRTGGLDFTRTILRSGGTECRINGRKVTKAMYEDKLSDVAGVPVSDMRIVSSGEVLSSLEPKELMALMMRYIPKELSVKDVEGMVTDITPEMAGVMEMNLPDPCTMDDIASFDSFCREQRKALKKQKDSLSARVAALPDKAPSYTADDLDNKDRKILDYEAKSAAYREKLKAYEDAARRKEAQDKKMAELKEAIGKITAEPVSNKDISDAEGRLRDLNGTMANLRAAESGAKVSFTELSKTLSAIEKPICPISPLITCRTDKSVAKAEVEDAIKKQGGAIESIEAELKKAGESIADTEGRLKALRTAQKECLKRQSLEAQLKALRDDGIMLPEKPEGPELIDTDSARKRISEAREYLARYSEGVKVKAELDSITRDITVYEALVKAVSEKGEVRTKAIASFLEYFEYTMNGRSGREYRFASEDGGVTVRLMRGGRPYALSELSGGEKAGFVFDLTDLLSELTGLRLMTLDEMSVLDNDGLAAILDAAKAREGDYDHIMIAAVDHDDTKALVRSRGIPEITY